MFCVPRTLLFVAWLAAAFAPTIAAEARSTEPRVEFRTQKDVLAWITHYREEPAPQHLPALVKAMARFGLLEDSERSGVYVGFVAGVLADNQTDAEKLVTEMFPLPPASQVVVIKGIAYSGLPEWKYLLGKFVERMPARKILIRKLMFGEAKTLRELPLTAGPEVLDAWWGFYFATGSYEPARRIIAATAWGGEKNDLEKLTVGSMAKWTLANNATRDKVLLDYMRSELANQPKPVRTHLAEAISAAETFETGKLRKAAVTSISELKAKGPEQSRKWAWWGQAGQIALAFGCVIAAAAGQVEFGIPCVVGGAAASAALRFYQMSQEK